MTALAGPRTIGGIALLALPQPYDFHASTERFRSYGADRANLWHEGGLHRVVAGREVRVEAAPGGVAGRAVRRRDRRARWHGSSGRRSTSRASGPGPPPSPCSPRSREPLAGYRPPLVADPLGDARDLDHRPAGVAALRLRRALAPDRALRRPARGGVGVPDPRADRRGGRERDPRGRLLDPQGRVRDGPRPRRPRPRRARRSCPTRR